MPKVIINGKEFEVPEGTNVLEACLTNGINLEHFCYHRYLPVDGNCRTCMVEIETPRGPMLTIGCNTKVTDGMVVHTTSEKATRAQKSALEFLLLDHPLDCPICDKAGECKLQDHYMDFGQYDHRRIVPRYFKEGKVQDAGDHIILDTERCILCTRCIRFLDNIPGTSELGIVRRGHEAKITTFPGKSISNDYSGNITDICPVGALTLKEFRFKQRVWFLKKAKSVCQSCARGCSITVEHNRGRVYRYMPRENRALNRTWICDYGRFSFTRLEENRLKTPLMKGQEASFESAAASLEEVLRSTDPSKIGAIVCGSSSLETMFAVRKLFEKLNSSHYAVFIPAPDGKGDDILRLPSPASNENGARLLGMPLDAVAIAEKAASGEIKLLIVVESDLLGSSDRAKFEGIRKAENLVVLTQKATETAKAASVALPVRNFVETNGSYVNATSLLQAARQAYEPENGDRILPPAILVSEMATVLGFDGFRFKDPVFLFDWIAKECDELSGYRFSTIPDSGIQLSLPPIGPPPFQNRKVDYNVVPDKQGVKI
jgi:NADH-quinone oxidoreductase subunit G